MSARISRPSHALAWASLASLTLIVGCTDRSETLLAPTAAPTRALAGTDDIVATSATDARLRHRASGLCIAVPGGTIADGTLLVLATCATGSAQMWRTLPLGTAGPLTVLAGSACMTLQYGALRADDRLGIRGCATGAGTQTWTARADGSLGNPFGRCVGVVGTPAAGAALTAEACVGDAASQLFDVVANAPVAPAPTPTPPPPPATSTDPRVTAIVSLMGAAPSVAAMEARGGVWARYESDFRTYANLHWTTSGAAWASGNYYDRAMIYYVWFARTGNTTYLSRANQMAVNYRRHYLEPNNYAPSAHWLQIDGVALHHLVTGDAASLVAVGRTADRFSSDTYLARLGGADFYDNRIQARTLVALLDAWKLRAPSTRGTDWAAKLRQALPIILATQSPDGAYREQNAQCGFNKPFMVGMLNDALIRYHDTFERDPRILPAVRRAVDYMWARNWISSARAFQYLEGTCTSPYGNGSPNPAPDLNGMIVSGFGWVGRMTGDAAYFTKGDAVFAGGVTGGYLGGQKQFNQQYTTSPRYLSTRF